MTRIKTRRLGLAAFIKMSGAQLIDVHNKEFIFESEKSESEWLVEYSNSCCMQHDAIVCQLRDHLKSRE
ncbi:MAG: hypothetical protein ABW007_02975 [Chitinophagaceae bacterium]